MRNLEWLLLCGLSLGMALPAQAAGEGQEAKAGEAFPDTVMRGSLMRSFAKFTAGGKARVAFMGGSVTTQQWRTPVMAYLRQHFPKTEFDFIMAGVGGTDANLGAFRLPRDVFGRGPVDLFFLEFAVNGGGVRAMEGIVRQAKRLNPEIEIVFSYFANTGHTDAFNKGAIPGIVQEHEKVAAAYGLPALFLYREVARRIAAGALTWQEFSRDSVHPTPKGCDLYAECITAFVEKAWANPALKPAPVATPERLDPFCYEKGHFVAPEKAVVAKGFRLAPGWTTEKTCNFAPPVDVLEATEPGAELSLEFRGSAVGLYLIVGFDAGKVEWSLDGAPFQTADLFDHYCTQFHRPQHRILADGLPDGPHRLVLRLAEAKNEKATGTAIRVLQFMVNGE